MRKKNENGARKTGWLAKAGKVLLFTFLFSTFMYQGLYQPKKSEADVTVLDSTWYSVNAGNPPPTALTYNAPAGNDRIVFVLIGNEQANGDIDITADPTPNVTVGGQNAYFVGNYAGGNAEVWVFYRLLGSSGSATGADIAVTWATNPTTGTMIAAATYAGVQQAYGIGTLGAINNTNGGGVSANGDIVVSGITAIQGGVGVLWINENNATANIGVTASLPWVFSENNFFPSTSNANELQTSQVAGVGGLSGDITHTVSGGRGAMVALALNPAAVGDTTPPTVSSVAVQTGLTVDVTFSEAMGTGVTAASNYTVSGTGRGTLATNPNSVALVSGNAYRLTWSSGEMLNGGDITITVANVQDLAGNPIGSPNSGTHTGGAIGVAPTVTINQAGGQADPTGTSPINFTVVFSEVVTGFATGDVTVTGTAGGAKTATVTGSGTTYNVAVTGMTTAGTVIASIAAGVAVDGAGNGNTASTSTDNIVTWATPPASPTGISLSNMKTDGPRITWNAVADATTYNVYRSTDGSTWGAAIGGVGSPTTAYGDTTAPNANTTYYWTVTAVNVGGESAKPAGVSGRTALAIGYNMVSAPYNLTGVSPVSAFGSWANWAWTWDSAGNVDPDNNGTWMTPMDVAPGHGMYVWSYNYTTVLTASGAANGTQVVVTLKPGWTIIANQLTTNMTSIGTNWLIDGATQLSAAVGAGTIGPALYVWNPGISNYDSPLISSNPTIEPWKSYMILNNTGVNHTLTIK